MKHTTSIIKLFSLALLLISGYACTGNFDKINQKDYQVDKEELGREGYNVGASLKGLQGLVIPTEEHLISVCILSWCEDTYFMGDCTDGVLDSNNYRRPFVGDWYCWYGSCYQIQCYCNVW